MTTDLARALYAVERAGLLSALSLGASADDALICAVENEDGARCVLPDAHRCDHLWEED